MHAPACVTYEHTNSRMRKPCFRDDWNSKTKVKNIDFPSPIITAHPVQKLFSYLQYNSIFGWYRYRKSCSWSSRHPTITSYQLFHIVGSLQLCTADPLPITKLQSDEHNIRRSELSGISVSARKW